MARFATAQQCVAHWSEADINTDALGAHFIITNYANRVLRSPRAGNACRADAVYRSSSETPAMGDC